MEDLLAVMGTSLLAVFEHRQPRAEHGKPIHERFQEHKYWYTFHKDDRED